METSWAAVRIGWAKFVLPFMFVLSPTLLMQGAVPSIVFDAITAMCGIYIATCGMVGYFVRPLRPWMRSLFALSGLLALIPAGAFPGAVITDVVGGVLGAALIAREAWLARSRKGLLAQSST